MTGIQPPLSYRVTDQKAWLLIPCWLMGCTAPTGAVNPGALHRLPTQWRDIAPLGSAADAMARTTRRSSLDVAGQRQSRRGRLAPARRRTVREHEMTRNAIGRFLDTISGAVNDGDIRAEAAFVVERKCQTGVQDTRRVNVPDIIVQCPLIGGVIVAFVDRPRPAPGGLLSRWRGRPILIVGNETDHRIQAGYRCRPSVPGVGKTSGTNPVSNGLAFLLVGESVVDEDGIHGRDTQTCQQIISMPHRQFGPLNKNNGRMKFRGGLVSPVPPASVAGIPAGSLRSGA